MRLITYLFIASMTTACGEITYKQGGSAQDIERAHQACRGAGEQLAGCLAKQGWQKPQMDAFDPLFATVTATDNRQPNPYSASPIIEVAPKQVTTNAPAVVAETPKQPSASKPALPATKPATAQATGAPAAPAAVAPATPTQSTVNDGPDVTYSINSWWKMGGFPDQLAKDQRSCEKKLGATYLPDYKTQTYKRAFIVCMHDAGWVAVRNVK